jgi:hypothetical protein
MTELAWAGSDPGAYSDAQWIKACVLDTGSGTPKSRYKLPIRTPQGGLDKTGVGSATDLIGHVKGASPAQVGTAARALVRARAQVGLPPSDALSKYTKS